MQRTQAVSTTPLTAYVFVNGEASDSQDEDIAGVYEVRMHLSRDIAGEDLVASVSGALAERVLEKFHEKQGIACVDDFTIEVRLEGGKVVVEMEDGSGHEAGLVLGTEFDGKVS